MKKSNNTTIIFYDAEFTGLHQKTTFISIGLVTASGKTFYAEFTDFSKDQVDQWIEKHVISNLILESKEYTVEEMMKASVLDDHVEIRGDSKYITETLTLWLEQFENIEIWSDCLSYDWVCRNSAAKKRFLNNS